MGQPNAYTRTKNFTDDAGSNTDHPAINSELDNAATSINQIRANLALIQRDDGSLTSIISGAVANMRNLIINGAFSINQRGVGTPTTLAPGAYGFDRWKAGAAGCTFTVGTNGYDNVITITAGSLVQIIGSGYVEGGVYTLSQKGTAQARIGVNNNLTPSSAYAACPQSSGVALALQSMAVEFTVGTIDRAQLELGTVVTQFERRFGGIELINCQRFFQVLRAEMQGYQLAGAGFGYALNWLTLMRSVPTVTFVGGTYTNASGLAAAGTTAIGARITALATATGTAAFNDWTVQLNAEL